ncbi:MAG: hypothetical protein V4590_09245 [Bacteroidota bacterium]
MTNIDLDMEIKTGLYWKVKTEDLWLQSGVFFLFLGTLPFLLQSLLFIAGFGVADLLFPFILIGVSAYYGGFCISKKMPVVIIVSWNFLMIGMLFAAGLISMNVYDFSYDGMWYHQDAVRLLEQGWNPYHHILSVGETAGSYLFVNHYPKAVWTSEAVVYAFSNKLESAKIINWIFLYASFCLSAYTLRKVFLFGWFWTVLIGLMISFNPVVICQLFSFYIDGIVANLILCLLLIVLLYIKGVLSLPLFLVLLSCTAIFLINTKFTALVYVCIFSAVYFAYQWFLKKREAIRTVYVAGSIVALGVLVFGYPTYVNNTLTKGHPFYPIMGEDNVGGVILNTPNPTNFRGRNRFEQFNLATFAKPLWSRAPESSKSKALFTIEGITIYDEYKRADPEMSGFGPLFAEVVFMLLGGILILLVWNRKVFTLDICIGLATLVFSIICIPAFWHARYAPQIWTLVCGVILLLLRTKYTAWLGYTILLIQLVNCSMVAQQNWNTQIQKTQELNAFFSELKSKNKLSVIFEGWTGSFGIKLKENNIPYVPVRNAYSENAFVYFPNVGGMCGAYVVKTRTN